MVHCRKTSLWNTSYALEVKNEAFCNSIDWKPFKNKAYNPIFSCICLLTDFFILVSNYFFQKVIKNNDPWWLALLQKWYSAYHNNLEILKNIFLSCTIVKIWSNFLFLSVEKLNEETTTTTTTVMMITDGFKSFANYCNCCSPSPTCPLSSSFWIHPQGPTPLMTFSLALQLNKWWWTGDSDW